MHSDRNLVILVVACLIIVWTIAAMRIGSDGRNIVPRFVSVPRALAPTIDPSFYRTRDVSSEEPATTSAPTRPSMRVALGVTARAFLVGNVRTGDIYLSYNSFAVMPVASMSKLVTAFVATDLISSTSTIEVTEESLQAPPDRSNLTAHERFTLDEALRPLLLSSSNIMAESIASSSDRAGFMESMKSYAWEVGMPNSNFADPSGVSPHNVASARDLFGLAKYLMYYRPDILSLTRTGTTTVATTTDHGYHDFVSTHPLVSDARFIGGKTGRTPEAGETMLTIMKIAGDPIAVVVLGCDYGARERDTRILLDKAVQMIGKK